MPDPTEYGRPDESEHVLRWAHLLAEVDGAMSGPAGWRFLREHVQDRYIRYARRIVAELHGTTAPQQGAHRP